VDKMQFIKIGLNGFDLYLPQPSLNDWHAFTTDI
jgi:hypothetical protein